MSLQEPTACRRGDKTPHGLETREDSYSHARSSKSLCVVSRRAHISEGFCREGSQCIKNRNCRKKHLHNRGEDEMKT